MFLKTNVKHIFLSEKFNYDFKNTNFSNKWFFDNVSYIYLFLKKKNQINSILEIGSYEGQSASFFLNYFLNVKLTCVDIWKNQNENYKNVNFDNVEKRLMRILQTIKVKLQNLKGHQKNFFFKIKLKISI